MEESMIKIVQDFNFGNMPFVFDFEDDNTLSCHELFIEGKTPEAKKALECDHFNDAIYSYVRLNILK
jgi:hypothetical protein